MKTKIISSDIYFVAALLTTGAKIDRENIDRTDPRHIKFPVYQDNASYNFVSENLPNATVVATLNGLDFYENLWDSGTMMVNAIAYKNAIQQVKTLVHAT